MNGIRSETKAPIAVEADHEAAHGLADTWADAREGAAETMCAVGDIMAATLRMMAKENGEFFAEIERLRHDLDKAMANHNADLNSGTPSAARRMTPKQIDALRMLNDAFESHDGRPVEQAIITRADYRMLYEALAEGTTGDRIAQELLGMEDGTYGGHGDDFSTEPSPRSASEEKIREDEARECLALAKNYAGSWCSLTADLIVTAIERRVQSHWPKKLPSTDRTGDQSSDISNPST